MSSASSVITYTSVYTDSELGRVFWGADEKLSDEGSPRVIVYGYDGLPMMPVAPPSPDYILGHEEPQTPPAPQDEDEHELMFIQPHDPDFMPEPIYPEYIPLEDEHILSAEEQPLPPIVLPTAESPDGGDDGDKDDGDSSRYDADIEDEDEPIIPPPSTDTATTGARITIRPQTSISFPPEAEVERLLPMPTPSPSPLTSLSPTSVRERLARCTALVTLPSPPLPPSLYPPPVDRRDDILESEQPPRKRLCLSTLGSRYEVGESSTRGRGVDYGFADAVEAEMRHRGIGEVGYGIKDTWIDLADAVPEMVPTTLEKVNTRVTELAVLHEHDTQDLYALLEDAQDVWIVEEEAYATREAWDHLVGLGQIVNHELQTLCEQVYSRQRWQIFERLSCATIIDSRDAPSDERHETGDGRHAGRVVSTTWAVEESRTARRGRQSP
nr:hypothetical protein [Tanacetum cinerariifolium]